MNQKKSYKAAKLSLEIIISSLQKVVKMKISVLIVATVCTLAIFAAGVGADPKVSYTMNPIEIKFHQN